MDINDELAALEASSQTALADPGVITAPAAPVPSGPVVEVSIAGDNPLQSSTIELELNPFQPLVPTAPAAAPAEPIAPAAPVPPAPAEPTPPVEPAPAAPAPKIPETPERRVYLHENMPMATKMAISVMANNPDLSPEEAVAVVNQRLGIQSTLAPQAAPASPAQPAAQEVTSLDVNARLDAIEIELANVDHVLDPEGHKALTAEFNKLTRQLPALIFKEQNDAQQFEIQRVQDSQITIDQSMNAARALYPDLALPDSPMTQAFQREYAALVESSHPLAAMPNCEEVLAYQVAAQLGILPSTHQKNQTPSPAPVAAMPSPAPAVSPAAPTPAAAPVASPQPGTMPAVGMLPVSGSQATSADRVTHAAPVDPQAALQASYQQATAAGDFAEMERLSGLMAMPANVQAPQGYGLPPAFAISISGNAA